MKLSSVSLDNQLLFDSNNLGVCSQAYQITNAQYLCNISKKKMKDEVDFLPADKYQRFLQVNTIILGVCSQTCPIYSK